MQKGFAEGVPTIEVTLGGKNYVLGCTMGSLKRAGDLGVLSVNAEDPTAMMVALPEYVWACLDEEGRTELSVAAIRELIGPHNMQAIAEKVGDLFEVSLPDPVPGGNASPAAAMERLSESTAGIRTSTSSSSEPLPVTT